MLCYPPVWDMLWPVYGGGGKAAGGRKGRGGNGEGEGKGHVFQSVILIPV